MCFDLFLFKDHTLHQLIEIRRHNHGTKIMAIGDTHIMHLNSKPPQHSRYQNRCSVQHNFCLA